MEKFLLRRPIPIHRYQEIVNVFVKYGFRMILEKLRLRGKLRITPGSRESKEKTVLALPVRVRMICEELGPTFIKFGQILSTRPDLVPLPLLRELEKLQDEIPPVKKEEIFSVIHQALKEKESMFASIDEIPIASGSLAQVHRARLHTGEEVVLKVKKPKVEEQIKGDIRILHTLAHLMERFVPELRVYEPMKIVEEFEKSVNQELNFLIEARNISLLRNVLEKDKVIKVPRVFEKFSTHSLLVTEYIEGDKLREIIEKKSSMSEAIGKKLTDSILEQIFCYGIFHADPHPGNIIVDKEGNIYFLDLGIIGRLSEEKRRVIVSLLYYSIEGDVEKVMRGLHTLKMFPEEIDKERLEWELEEFMNKYQGIPLAQLKISQIIGDLLQIFREFKLRLPYNLSLMFKALLTWEGVYVLLAPEKDIVLEMKDVLLKSLKQNISLSQVIKQLGKLGEELSSFSHDLPGLIDSLRNILKKGYVNVAFEHRGLKDFTSTIDKSSYRISFSLIIASLIVASSLIIVSGKGPKWLGLPSLGIAGYVLSGFLGLWLIVGILKGRRM